jgi:hypothetical protein
MAWSFAIGGGWRCYQGCAVLLPTVGCLAADGEQPSYHWVDGDVATGHRRSWTTVSAQWRQGQGLREGRQMVLVLLKGASGFTFIFSLYAGLTSWWPR